MNEVVTENRRDAQAGEQATTSFLLERLWSTYSLNDNRRRRSFYFLFTTTVIFGILFIVQPNKFELPLIKTEVSFFIAMLSAPSFILVFYISYIYLCAHTIHSFVTYLVQFNECHEGELNNIGVSFVRLHAYFKQKDVSEGLNIFLFPSGPVKDWDDSINLYANCIAHFFLNILILMTLIVPFVMYIGIVNWLFSNYQGHIENWIGIIILFFYILTSTAFIFGPIYFYFRVKPAKDILESKIWRK